MTTLTAEQIDSIRKHPSVRAYTAAANTAVGVCLDCGWIIVAEGCYISEETLADVAGETGAAPSRCSDSACTC